MSGMSGLAVINGFDADFPVLGFNPAPGNPENVDGLVAKLTKAANAMESAQRTLTAVGQAGGIWEGDAAQAFAGKIGELPRYLDDSVEAMRQASSSLDNWKNQLASYQETARRYEAEAESAKTRLDAAKKSRDRASDRYDSAADDPAFGLIGVKFDDQATFSQAQNRIDAATAEYQAAGDALEAANRDLQAIKEELEAIVKQAEELFFHHQDDAGRTAKTLRRANQNAPEISAWEKLGNSFKNMGKKIKGWATEHAAILKKIGDISSGVSAVLGIAALATMWCPPLSAGLGLASAATSAVALGAHGMAKLGGADVSWTSIAMDGVGAVPFGTSAFKGLKAAKGAITGAEGVAKVVVKGEGLVANGAKVARAAGSELSTIAKEGSFMHKFVISPVMVKTPLRALPGAEFLLKDGKAVLDAQSWYSRGTQIAMKGAGLIKNAPNLYEQVTGS